MASWKEFLAQLGQAFSPFYKPGSLETALRFI